MEKIALVHVEFLSESLNRIVSFNAIIPNDTEMIPGTERVLPRGGMQTLYLLHGLTGNYTDWLGGTRIQEYARKYNVAVIMPSGDNSFYLDDEDKSEYFGEFIGKELIDYTRNLFHLSNQREDTFIGGLSMGGYGAMRNGLKYADKFSRIVSFSGAFIILDIIENNGEPVNDGVTKDSYKRRVFGDLKNLKKSDKNPTYLVEQLQKEGKDIPEILMTCGTEDDLLSLNQKIKNQLKEAGATVTYIENEGTHNWDYWNKHLEEAIQWVTNR